MRTFKHEPFFIVGGRRGGGGGGYSWYFTVHVNKVQERCRVSGRLVVVPIGIRNQGGHTNAQSLQQIYAQ